MKNLYLLTLLLSLWGAHIHAQETENEVAALNVAIQGAFQCGTVQPEGKNIIVNTYEKIPVSASPKSGYSFSGWILEGDAEISSTTNPDIYAVLSGNTMIKACFYKNDGSLKGQLTLKPSSDKYGSVSPNDMKKIDLGRIFNILAKPLDGFKFLKWKINGMAQIENIISNSTKAVIFGDAELIALFASEDDVYDISVYSSGENSTPINISVLKGDSIDLTADYLTKKFFSLWSTNNGGKFLNNRAAQTSFTPNASSSVFAVFAPAICNFSNKSRKITVKIKNNPEKNIPPVGDLKLKMMPMCLGPNDFNPNTDKITLYLNGIPFDVNNTIGSFRRTPVGYKYKANEKTQIKLNLDFMSAVWSFSAKKINLNYLKIFRGCDVMLYVNGLPFGHKYIPDEKLSISFKDSKHPAQKIPGFPLLIPKKMSLKLTTSKKNADSMKLFFSQIPLSDPFNSNKDFISLTINEFPIIIPPNSMIEKNASFSLKNKNLSLKFNTISQSLSIALKQTNIPLINFDENLKITLQIGKNKAAAILNPEYSQKLKFSYDAFYWK